MYVPPMAETVQLSPQQAGLLPPPGARKADSMIQTCRHFRPYNLLPGVIALILFSIWLIPAQPVYARAEDSTLFRIWSPHDGQPVLTQPGGSIEILLRRTGPTASLPAFSLVGADGTEHPLSAAHTGTEQSVFERYSCMVPDTITPGGWALQVREPDGTVDTNRRAVWIFEKEPAAYYVLAHLTDVHIGKQRTSGPDPETMFSSVIEAINGTDAALCAITGDITEYADPRQFQLFLSLLDRFKVPTLVCSGNHDRDNLQYERFFGAQTWARTFGSDGFLVFDTKDYVVADDWGPQPGTLYRLRRMLRPCRFTIGLTHRYESSMGMRAQLILFVDDPIDLLLYGHTHRERRPGEGPSWGTFETLITPAGVDGYYRLIDITAQGPIPRPVSQVAVNVPETGNRGPNL